MARSWAELFSRFEDIAPEACARAVWVGTSASRELLFFSGLLAVFVLLVLGLLAV